MYGSMYCDLGKSKRLYALIYGNLDDFIQLYSDQNQFYDLKKSYKNNKSITIQASNNIINGGASTKIVKKIIVNPNFIIKQ